LSTGTEVCTMRLVFETQGFYLKRNEKECREELFLHQKVHRGFGSSSGYRRFLHPIPQIQYRYLTRVSLDLWNTTHKSLLSLS